MSTPLLATKLYIPPARPGLVPRPRLTRRLNEGLSGKLTLIAAPAGYGKTTLISEWLNTGVGSREYEEREKAYQSRAAPPTPYSLLPTSSFAWLSLDEGDNDLTRFLTYLVAALQPINPNLGQTSQRLLQASGPHLPNAEAVISALINDIATTSTDTRQVLVLDDYHLIETKAIHTALTFLLDHLPAQLHLLIATRMVPPLPLSRLRARGQLAELHAADLRFTTAEIAEFLNTSMGLDLSAADVAALETRTEGWIAGLQLAALSLQEQPNRSDFIKAFTGDDRYVLDYLLDEVFSLQPVATQNFLLQTAILDRLCGPLCDAVLGQAEIEDTDLSSLTPQPSAFTLEQLEKANLFIVPLDNKREWYRYHPLLLDLLRHRLNFEIGQQGMKRGDTGSGHPSRSKLESPSLLHHRAARWYEEHDLTTEALSHLFAAGDFAQAARLVEQVGAMTLWERGEVTTLWSWLEKLPLELVHTRPKLCLYWAETMYLTGQLAAIEPLLRSAELHLHQANDEAEAKNMLGEVMAIRALVAGAQGQSAQTSEAIELTDQALALLSDEELRLRGLLTIGLAEAYYLNGSVVEAGRVYARAIDLGQASQNPFLVIAGMTRLAEVQIIQGQLRRAAETCQHMQQLALASVHLPGNLAWSALLREWNQLAAAKEQAQAGLKHGKLESNPRLLVQAYVTLARILQAQGDFTGAHEAVQTAAQLKQQQQLALAWDLPPVAAYQSWLWLRQDNVAAAAHWAEEQNLHPTAKLNYQREIEYLILARVLLAQRRAAEVVDLLHRLQQAAEKDGRLGRVIEALALLALAYQMLDDPSAALTALDCALTLAEPEGYIRLFVDEGPPMAILLKKMKAEGGRRKDYILKLLSAFVGTGGEITHDKSETSQNLHPSSSASARGFSLQPLIEPLTNRELEILHLITQGLSNAEIAEKLVLTIGTVKVHTRNIYGKLGVGSRTQAVAKARELKLL